MPGSIKISGAQKTIAAPYIKVSGTWKPASAAYVKVSGTWRQWYAAEITDNFNRSNSSTLGTTSNGITSWANPNSSYAWQIVSNTAHIGIGVGVNNQLSTVTSLLNSPNYEVRVDIPENYGAGIAVWVQDWLNWWGVVTDIVTTNNYSCPSGGTLSGTNCITSSTYNATASTYNCGLFTQVTETAPAELIEMNAGTCSVNFGSCTGTVNGTTYNGSCVYGECWVSFYTCSHLSGTGWSLSGSTCSRYNNTCPSGGSDPCNTCVSYSCPAGGSLSGTTCTVSGSYAATNTPTYDYKTVLKRRNSGTITTVASYSHTNPVRSLKVVTSNDSIIISSYAGVGQTTLMNTNTYASSSTATATKTATAGILMQAANSNQASYVDNFYMK